MAGTSVDSTDNVVDFLKAQHETIKSLFAETLNAPDNDKRTDAFTRLRTLLAVHETAEEMMVHPRARRKTEGGDAVVDALLQEEHQAKAQLQQIERMDIGSAEFTAALTELQSAVLKHAAKEESEEFNKLEADLDADELKKMASAVKAAERIAPTHPHAGVESAVANFVAGPFASMLDRARDAIKQAIS
jgi:hypothetical protein